MTTFNEHGHRLAKTASRRSPRISIAEAAPFRLRGDDRLRRDQQQRPACKLASRSPSSARAASGLNIVQGAAPWSAAQPIIAVDLFDNRLELARKPRARRIRSTPDQQDAEAEIRNASSAKRAWTWPSTTLATSKRHRNCLPPHRRPRAARSSSACRPRETAPRSTRCRCISRKRITGSHGGESLPDIDIPSYVRLCQAGKLDLKGLISRR